MGMLDSLGQKVLDALGVKQGPKSDKEKEEAKARMDKDNRDTKSMNMNQRRMLEELKKEKEGY